MEIFWFTVGYAAGVFFMTTVAWACRALERKRDRDATNKIVDHILASVKRKAKEAMEGDKCVK